MGRRVLVIMSVIIMIAALGFIGYKLFRVREISVDGCEALTEEHIIVLSGIAYDQHLLTLHLQKAAEAIEADPFVKAADIEIDYPYTIVIAIEERTPAACVTVEGAIIVIDYDGYVLEVGTDTHPYPQVNGLQIGDFVIGQRIGAQDEFRLDVLSRVLAQTDASGIEIASVDVTRTADIQLVMPDGLTVELGDDTQLAKKLDLAMTAWETLSGSGESGGILDVASADTAYYREN